ncbi:MAG: hypothetical protein KA714_24525 [Limnoraphis sp. WC205]|nr:hypothetical protein [Limnoraphis sp. WC205]
MNSKSILQQIYLITVTLIYMLAVVLVLTAIVAFAISDEILKKVKPSKKSPPQKLVYPEFKPLKNQTISSKQEQLLNRF